MKIDDLTKEQVVKLFLAETRRDFPSCPNPKCSRKVQKSADYRCPHCGGELITPVDKILAEVLLSESQSCDLGSDDQQRAIEKAAKKHGIDLSTSAGQDEAFRIAYSMNPKLFQQGGEE